MFILDPKLMNNALFIGEMPLCSVLLMNNALYPWIILVPKRNEVLEITDLLPEDRAELIEEVALASQVMKETYWPDKINVASMGNNVPQLHMHIIARFKTDDIWPEPVWGKPGEPYPEECISEVVTTLRKEFAKVEEFQTIANDG